MSLHLTGLDYSDWEQKARHFQQVAARSEKTGWLDATHLDLVDYIAEALADELHVVDDVRDLSDQETAVELGVVWTRLSHMRSHVASARLRMRRLASRKFLPGGADEAALTA